MKKSRLVGLLLILAMALTVLSGCGGDGGEDQDGAKTYVIGTDIAFAPFEFEDKDGNFVGVDMELLAAIAEDQDFQYKIDVLGFNAAVQALEAGQVDCVMAGMSITEERQAKFDFSDPYYDSNVVMGIAADNDTIKSYDDIKGQKVAVKTGTEGVKFAESIKDKYELDLVYFDDSNFMYEDVKKGNSVALFEDFPVLNYGINQGVGLKIVTERERGSSYGIAVGKGKNTELIEKFNAGLKNIKESGKYKEILEKYNAY